ncbi:MAG: hypothetical protein ER33_06305 [Cyanobium sp. CACIAM 14]|nr:MAG: hypothetical protein ER33_06305 [Cyanobium sp. CACIAM 14]
MRTFLADLLERLHPARSEAPSPEAVEALVEAVLESLGVEGARDESDEGVVWSLQVGSAPIEIALQTNEVLQEPTIEICAPILRLPAANLLAFYRRCLELNRIVVGCAIGVEDDVVMVAAERRLPGLDRAQFVEMLLNVASAADEFDDVLAAEFGAEKLGEEPDPPA